MRLLKPGLLVLFALLVTPALAAPVSLAGQVTYRERVALPESAVLNIQLLDQTLPALPPRINIEAPIGPGQVPLSFNLTFENALILPGHSYALTAAIRIEGGTLFRTAEPYALDPLAPAQPVLIVVSPAAPVVAPSAPSSEPPPPERPAILDVTWYATAIAGEPVLPRATPTLTIGSDLRAGGSGGCNSWFAEARIDADRLQFGSVTATQKGCTQSVNLEEQAFHTALAATAAWQVSGDDLTLFGADGKALLQFRR